MKSMLNLNHFNFSVENQENSKNVSTYNPTHSVPASRPETRSLNKIENCLQTSFQRQANSEYPELIWEASLNYLKKCYLGQFDEKLGLNDQSIYLQLFDLDSECKDLEGIISRNKLLSVKQREQIYLDLKYESGFKSLLENLCSLFKEEIFHEIIFVCNWAWEKYLNYKKSKKTSPVFQLLNLKTVLDFEIEEEQTLEDQFIPLNDEEVTNQAMKTAEEISGLIYLQKDIKYINLMEAEGEKGKDIREQFSIFIRSITKSVFLCLEGYFTAPEIEEQFDNWSLNDDSFSESQQKNEEENESFGCRKERKYE